MFMSSVWLDPQRRGARRLLASPQRLHAVVAGAVSQGAEPDRPLWRLDPFDQGLLLLVVSRNEPDFSSLLEQADLPPEHGWRSREYGPFLDGLECGQLWRFRLVANPVRSVREVITPGVLPRGKRVPVVGVSNLEDWFVSRGEVLGVVAERGGFVVTSQRTDDFRRRGETAVDGRPSRVVISSARYDGVLKVTDPDMLRRALTTGVGSAKAYGCGLLSLAPVP